jgi:hypothetical protein
MDESVEEDVIEEVNEQIIDEPIKETVVAGKVASVESNVEQQQIPTPIPSRLSFNDIDYVQNQDGAVSNVNAPKNISRLEEISSFRAQQRKQDEEEDEDSPKLQISTQPFNLDALDIHNIEEPSIDLLPDLLIDEIEILD